MIPSLNTILVKEMAKVRTQVLVSVGVKLTPRLSNRTLCESLTSL